MKAVLFYEPVDDVMPLAMAHFEAHVAHAHQHHHDGGLLLLGTFADPQAQGSMAVFTTVAAAEAFVERDPFVLHGVVRRWWVQEWDEVLAG